MNFRRINLCALIAALVICGHAGAQDWTRFRGPNGTGIAATVNVPNQWSAKDYNWRVKLPAAGHSSPVVWGDRIFLTGADDASKATRFVFCVRASDGKLLWKRQFDSAHHRKHRFNSFASSTPAVDEERLYVSWSTPDAYTLIALDHDGKDVWRRNLGPYVSQHSCGTSPIVYQDLVVLGNDQDEDGGGKSFLIAVDRKTGETRWKLDRRSARVAYSTPFVYSPAGKDELIFNSMSHGVTSVDPASGRLNWEIGVVENDPLLDKRSVSSSMLAGDLLIASCGSGAGGNYVVAVKPGNGSRDAQLAYKVDRSAPYVPTPLAQGKLLFLWSDKGVVSCLDANSGKAYWQRRVGGNFFSSPICIDGRLLNVATDGKATLLAASEEYSLLGEVDLADLCHATPAVSDGVVYLRTYHELMSLGGKQK